MMLSGESLGDFTPRSKRRAASSRYRAPTATVVSGGRGIKAARILLRRPRCVSAAAVNAAKLGLTASLGEDRRLRGMSFPSFCSQGSGPSKLLSIERNASARVGVEEMRLGRLKGQPYSFAFTNRHPFTQHNDDLGLARTRDEVCLRTHRLDE
jgi:hypothetical protein